MIGIRAIKRAAVATALVLGLTAGAGAMASSAGATPISPGPMGCTTGTDNCGGWVASSFDPTCVAYNINWTHDWDGTPGGTAHWHVVADQWWNGGASCTAGGGAHLIGSVGDFYEPDYMVPHVEVQSGHGFLEFIGHEVSGPYGGLNVFGTYNVTAWTRCIANTDANGVYVSAAGYPTLTWTAGSYSVTATGTADTVPATCGSAGGILSGVAVNGSYIAWGHQNFTWGANGTHAFTYFQFR